LLVSILEDVEQASAILCRLHVFFVVVVSSLLFLAIIIHRLFLAVEEAKPRLSSCRLSPMNKSLFLPFLLPPPILAFLDKLPWLEGKEKEMRWNGKLGFMCILSPAFASGVFCCLCLCDENKRRKEVSNDTILH
jgi:hypothetical protein